MADIILIETSTALCSTALVRGGCVTSVRESEQARSQAALTAPFIKEMLDAEGLKVSDCDAVCVSSGPGSYTGLRVGVSTAKGLCFAAGIPLLSVNTLDILVRQAEEEDLIPEGCTTVIPMIDARRMEVYTAVYRMKEGVFRRNSEISPKVVDSESFADLRSQGPILFIGDGAAKCEALLSGNGSRFVQTCPHAKYMAVPAIDALNGKRFENTAYFEPFYLKQFVATVSGKGLVPRKPAESH